MRRFIAHVSIWVESKRRDEGVGTPGEGVNDAEGGIEEDVVGVVEAWEESEVGDVEKVDATADLSPWFEEVLTLGVVEVKKADDDEEDRVHDGRGGGKVVQFFGKRRICKE